MATAKPRGVSIRAKLLLSALALLLIPWMGYEYVRNMRTFLLQGQENALALTARAVSTVLNDRPEFFDPETGVSQLTGKAGDIFAHALQNYILLDGNGDDWGEQLEQLTSYDGSNGFECGPDFDPDNLSFESMIGYRGPYIFALFKVTDDRVVTRDLSLRRLDSSDHLRLAVEDPGGRVKRYLLTARQPGRMSVYLMDDEWKYPLTGDPNYDLAAEMALNERGYSVEMRIPRFIAGSQTRLGFVVADIDDAEQREVRQLLAASTQAEVDEPLSNLFIHSPEIAKILRGLNRPVARIWVLDQQQRVRAVVGKLSSDQQLPRTQPKTLRDRMHFWYSESLRSIYDLILGSPSPEITDISTDVSQRNDATFKKVLAGFAQTERRPSLGGQTEILMAASPVWSGDRTLGVVVVEQSSNEVLIQQKQVLENVIAITIIVLTIITTALLWFATTITSRIRRLRNATDLAIGVDGRVRNPYISEQANAGDEIGDLSRSVSGMLTRLSQYTGYLEGLPDTLAHELRNPLNVVNSSLDILQEEIPSTQDSKYMARAKSGIVRLGSILTNLTEAVTLEEAMQTEARERFDLVQLVSTYVEGYRLSHPDRHFDLDVRASPLNIEGAPDHIAQMLDKLADNAIDFGKANTPVLVRLEKYSDQAHLSVMNEGPALPDTMSDRLFDPMVSIGKKNAKQSRLGLGLHVVKLIAEFHQGKVEAYNRPDSRGAMFTVSLPLAA